jgi:phosphoenolpyruvate carboxylase
VSDSHVHSRDLSTDVRELGELLGDVIRTQTSETAFEVIEDIRTAAIDYRDGTRDSREPVRTHLAGAGPASQETIARAFTTYFTITNLAEERERVRAVRRGQQEGRLADSIESAVERLADRGADAATLERVLEDTLIQPTFTAHPTEARRKTIKAKLRTMDALLERLDEHRLTDREHDRIFDRLEAELTSLWQTALVRDRRPAVTDETLDVQWYLENVLFDIIPAVGAELDRVLGETYEDSVAVPTLYEFRSWAGSDRDGNPYVSPAITESTLDRQRGVALSLYREATEDLLAALSETEQQIGVDDAFEERVAARQERLPETATAVESRNPGEPYRQFLDLIDESLARVDDVLPGGYRSDEAFVTDLAVLEQSLRANDADQVADTYVRPLRRQADTFGFTLASLDVRDHQAQHTTAVTAALEREGIEYDAMDEAARVDLLTEAILQDRPVVDLEDTTGLDESAERVLTRFARLADWQREYGVDAIDTYCISMCEEPSHVLEVLFLADQAGVVDLPGHCGLDLVPLLETEYALSGAKRIMRTLFENEAYASALAARDEVQEVMLGYSDSNKENGFLAANWSLYVNQKRLAAVTDAYDIDLRLFHGRGGSISRGGGPMNDALLALPTETVSGQVKFTEQGETISQKYANPAIGGRNLEQMLNAQLRARYDALQGETDAVPDAWHEAMETAADAARDAYRDLLETEGFVAYFEAATPIRIIEDLNLGSRPASRSGERTVEDLRAIPWVFSWTQARCILPGWYSLASGLSAYLDAGGDLETLQAMYAEWPFFRTTLDNAALSLARTELEIATEYADLASAELREQFFPTIRAEYESACDLVGAITGRETLLDRAWLRESLDRRNPYVDPLNLLQVRLLGADDRSDAEQRALRLTVKGIAEGMQTTG